jgi:pimeloyl-ACP methyl ester carboxylesterase
MVNGIGATVKMWGPLAACLSRTRSLVMFDAPGAWMSPPLKRAARMPRLARIVLALLDHLNLAQVDVLGYSWGGALAQQLARDAPTRIRRLVLAATTPGLGGRPPSPTVLALMASPLRFGSTGHLAAAAPRLYGGDARDPDARTRAMLQAWSAAPPTGRGYAQQLYAIGTWSSLPWLRTVRTPTLLIQGDDDPLVPARNGRMMMRRLPSGQLFVAAGGGHLWPLERPDDAAAVVERFLA